MEKKYPNFYKETGYGTATGLCGINCRHSFHPYYPGSARTYTQEQLNAWKKEKVEYNGQKMSVYDATQKQRAFERQIRQDKKDLKAQQAILTSNNKDIDIEQVKNEIRNIKATQKDHNAQLNDFLKQTGLNKDNSRLVI